MSRTEGAEPDLAGLIDRLTLEEKVSLLTGGSAWATVALPGIGLRPMVLSDGPSGVRGATWDEREPSLCLPSATALSSSWDVELARQYGAVAAAEARRKGVDVILGPTVNLHRSPLGGRHFEAFSEDPVLTADLAAAYVEGVQEQGVGATLKHYVANDFETDRYHADVQVSDRALRELYLLAFERGVREAGVWCVMSAYNAVNGVTATENDLLTDPLTATWGFDGVVVSDWTAVRSLESARQPQDLAMPGPEGPWGPHLVAAVRDGHVAESAVDRKVERILRLAARVGALEGTPARPVARVSDGRAFAQHAAAEGMVLVRNEGLLPLVPDRLASVAVLGESAVWPRIQGGGSAMVVPDHAVSPLAGLRRALPETVVLDHHLGAVVQHGFAPLDPTRMTNPATGGPGAHLTYYDGEGEPLYTEERFASLVRDFAPHDLDAQRASVTFATRYLPEQTEDLQLGFAGPGRGRLLADDKLVLDAEVIEGPDQVQSFFAPPFATTPVPVVVGHPVELRWEFIPGAVIDGVPGSLSVTFGTEPRPRSIQEEHELVRRAAEAARTADIAIVVVGTDADAETEGYDRSDLRLPGRQDELVSAVAAVNPRTVVIVNAGAPVEMPWRHDVAAILLTWFGGQEYGHALADVLLGRVEPGGRLPTSWPEQLRDVPVANVTPVDGILSYAEGIHIGYRAWLRANLAPAYPFGFGLGYTDWTIGPASVTEADDQAWDVRVDVSNTGNRAGKQVVQVYARCTQSAVDRPALWLVGFAVVRAQPGQTASTRIRVPHRALAYWDDGWVLEPAEYEFLVGSSVADLGDSVVSVTVGPKR